MNILANPVAICIYRNVCIYTYTHPNPNPNPSPTLYIGRSRSTYIKFLKLFKSLKNRISARGVIYKAALDFLLKRWNIEDSRVQNNMGCPMVEIALKKR